MEKERIINYFGSVRATAEALGLSTQAVYAWPDIAPEKVALKVERLSKGKVKYKEGLYQ